MKGINSKITKSVEDNRRIDKVAKLSKARKTFEQNCFWLLINSYKSVYNKNEYDHQNWEENTYSANVVKEMKKIDRENKHFGYIYSHQTPEYTEDFYKGVVKNTSKFYDFSIHFITFSRDEELIFGFEAKLLTENNYLKKKASGLNNEYVSERGFLKFANKLYKERGCMIGFILEGTPQKVVKNINKILEKKNRENEKLQKHTSINNCDFCYETNHINLDYPLIHFMLLFDKQDDK